MRLSAFLYAAAVWFSIVGCFGPIAADTFTFAPTDSTLEFQSTVVMERARYTDDVAETVDSTRVTSYIRIDTAAGGYDLTTHQSKSLDQATGEFDAVITMGCGDNCPWIPARRREDWALPDPRDMDDDGYRAVRDEIGARVKALVESL